MVSAHGVLRLAPGLRLNPDSEPMSAMLCGAAAGEVHLNRHALAILELCDGSRSRDRIVVDAMLRSAGAMRAADVLDFLAAAEVRGWLIEGPA
jgi:hypothetical protein